MTDLTRSDDIERDLFRKYSIALKMWARRFNTAEIAAHLGEPEQGRAAVDLALAGD